jgi:hypothetical protein
MNEWTLIIITWLGLADPIMQELEMEGFRECDARMMHLNELFVEARETNPEFGFILECTKNER